MRLRCPWCSKTCEIDKSLSDMSCHQASGTYVVMALGGPGYQEKPEEDVCGNDNNRRPSSLGGTARKIATVPGNRGSPQDSNGNALAAKTNRLRPAVRMGTVSFLFKVEVL